MGRELRVEAPSTSVRCEPLLLLLLLLVLLKDINQIIKKETFKSAKDSEDFGHYKHSMQCDESYLFHKDP